jgi:hypothetical protein
MDYSRSRKLIIGGQICMSTTLVQVSFVKEGT